MQWIDNFKSYKPQNAVIMIPFLLLIGGGILARYLYKKYATENQKRIVHDFVQRHHVKMGLVMTGAGMFIKSPGLVLSGASMAIRPKKRKQMFEYV